METISSIRKETLVLFLLLSVLLLGAASCASAPPELTLHDAWRVIKEKRFVDLTHAFAPGVPHWKGFPDEQRLTLYWYEPGVGKLGSGFFAQSFTHVGQWGTHVDPPAHFAKGLRCAPWIRST